MDAPDKDLEPHFRFLFDRLKENYDGYSNYVFTTTATILLIIGWLLTSKDARAYIAAYPPIKWVMTVAIVLFVVAEIWFSRGAAMTSDGLVKLIKTLPPEIHDNIITRPYYRPKIVPLRGVIILVAAHLVLYAVLVAIIWSISPGRRAPVQAARAATGRNQPPA